MSVTPLDIPDVLLVAPRVFRDDRGHFFESWQQERYAEAGIPGPFVQDNVSVSHHGVVRGLHYQEPFGQGKLVSCLRGRVFDVAVDLRRGSPTFGAWVGAELSDENGHQLWVPAGFAHGFQVLSDEAVFAYKVTEPYVASAERSIRWDDPAIGIVWPFAAAVLSPKDAVAPLLADMPPEHLPLMAPAHG
jgi:dTDP-4-dehydrorhamnose 3,5-epimerase